MVSVRWAPSKQARMRMSNHAFSHTVFQHKIVKSSNLSASESHKISASLSQWSACSISRSIPNLQCSQFRPVYPEAESHKISASSTVALTLPLTDHWHFLLFCCLFLCFFVFETNETFYVTVKKHVTSPRQGIERGVIHFNWCHFSKVPAVEGFCKKAFFKQTPQLVCCTPHVLGSCG